MVLVQLYCTSRFLLVFEVCTETRQIIVLQEIQRVAVKMSWSMGVVGGCKGWLFCINWKKEWRSDRLEVKGWLESPDTIWLVMDWNYYYFFFYKDTETKMEVFIENKAISWSTYINATIIILQQFLVKIQTFN